MLLAMADLLSSLESSMSFVPGIADKLRLHVSRIDQYMTASAMDRRRAQVYHNALPPSAWTTVTPMAGLPPGPMRDSSVRTDIQSVHISPPLQHSSLSPETDTTGGPSSWATPGGMLSDGLDPHSSYAAAAAGFVDDLLKVHPAELPPDAQFILPTDLLVDWPFELGAAFDFLGTNTL